MSWSIEDYLTALSEMGKWCTGMQRDIEHHLWTVFPPNTPESILAPCLIIDLNDKVLVWFLPSLLDVK